MSEEKLAVSMDVREKNISRLVDLAVGRASLEAGVSTATRVGDREWIYQAQDRLEWYNKEMESLRQTMSKKDVSEAQRYTNAYVH
jgi:hypothetical protein